MRRLAVLRPEPGASQTLERARALGLEAFALPLFTVEPVGWNCGDRDEFDAILLTSANAIRYAGKGLGGLAHLPVYAVGTATAEAAREAGMRVAWSGRSGASDLIASLEPGLRLLHLAGEDRIEHQPPAGVQIESVTVYRARPLPNRTGLRTIEGSVALVHSPRAGRRLAELAEGAALDRRTVIIAAISPAAAAAAGAGWGGSVAAETPSDNALLALAAKLCKMSGEP